MLQQNADVVIIGGGVIGLSIAYSLAQRHLGVTVLDARKPGQASRAAAGMLSPLAEAQKPGAAFDLMLSSHRLYPEFLQSLKEETGISVTLNGPGTLRAAMDSAQASALRGAFEWQQDLGLPLQWLSPHQAVELEPLISRDLQGAILSESEQHLVPEELLAALAAACRKQRVLMEWSEEAMGFEIANHQVEAVLTDNARYACGQVIVAGGSWSRLIANMLPGTVNIPITPIRGQMAALGPYARPLIRHTLYTHGAYLVPRPTGRIAVGATMEDAGWDARPTAGGIRQLLNGAARLVPDLAAAPFESVWAGLRPVSWDGMPLLGALPGYENAFIASGHGRNGILLAPATGRLMADLLLTKSAPELLPFSPARAGESQCALAF